MMKNGILIVGLCAVALGAHAEDAVSTPADPHWATDPVLVRYMDRAEAALERAQEEAGKDMSFLLRPALKRACDVWSETDKCFRGLVTGDGSWVSDFDAITASLQNANDALARWDRAGVKTHLDQAVATFTAIRTRNGVPALRNTFMTAFESIGDLAKAIAALSTDSAITADQLATIRPLLEGALEDWGAFTKMAMNMNAIGLDEDAYKRVEQLLTVEDTVLTGINEGLSSPEVREFLSGLSESKENLEELRESIEKQLAAAAATSTQSSTGDATNVSAATTEKAATQAPQPLFGRSRRRFR